MGPNRISYPCSESDAVSSRFPLSAKAGTLDGGDLLQEPEDLTVAFDELTDLGHAACGEIDLVKLPPFLIEEVLGGMFLTTGTTAARLATGSVLDNDASAHEGAAVNERSQTGSERTLPGGERTSRHEGLLSDDILLSSDQAYKSNEGPESNLLRRACRT
jgi:hypothetical protein